MDILIVFIGGVFIGMLFPRKSYRDGLKDGSKIAAESLYENGYINERLKDTLIKD